MQAYALVLFWEMLGNLSCTNLWMPSLLRMILWFADVLLLHQNTPFCYSESWHGLFQCSDQQWTCTIIPVVLHQLRVCYHFWTYQSNHTYSASVNHCSHTVLKVFNRFMPLVHMEPTKTVLLNNDFLWKHMASGMAILTALQHKNWSSMVENPTW